MEPIVIRKIVPEALLKMMQQRSNSIKASGFTSDDEEVFKRRVFHNDPYFKELHHTLFLPLVMKKIMQPLKASYNFLSFYDRPESVCPLHMDREQCYLTLDLCLDIKKPWPLYVYPQNYPGGQVPEDKAEEVKKNCLPILLNAGDAVIYSGSRQPHWRSEMGPGNSCDMVFFHFVPVDFSGDLN